MSARSRDRRVYLESHPALFLLLAVLRRRPVVRLGPLLGRRVVVNGTEAYRQVLTEVPLDRVSERTTGGAIQRHEGPGALFDQSGAGHRASRRALAERLDSRGVSALRPVWQPVLDEAAANLGAGLDLDLCTLADDLSGRTTAALVDRPELDAAACRALAVAARRTASSAAAEELPTLVGVLRRRQYHDHLAEAFGDRVDPLGKMLALAAVNTTYAAIPRAVAWTADAGLWGDAADPARRGVLVAELLRVIAPTPVLPRVPAQDATLGDGAVERGEQLLLVVRHAVGAHDRGPSVDDPAPPAVSQLVFGAGRHACPGARLARAQLDDVLAALAPYAPSVVRARVDRRAALPAWGSLVVRATS